MKHAVLRSIVHNVADSLGSGVGLMIGCYGMDIYGEAQRSPTGAITVDFLEATVIEGDLSASLANSVALYRAALAGQCLKEGGSIDDVVEAKARFWPDLRGGRFSVTVSGKDGRRSTTEYVGTPGQRVKILDGLGRVRPKPNASTA
jgi:hypothetical protein